jgi:hypothetical protein
MKIGDTVWVWDGNVRVYKDKGGGPDFRSSFVAHVIFKETRSSWLLDGDGWDALKVDKKTLELRGANLFGKRRKVFVSPQEIEDDIFVNDYRHRIATAVERCQDATTLRAIQELLR